MDAVRPSAPGKCPEDYHACGKGDVSHEVCVLSSSECPIDDIIISQEDPSKEGVTYKSAELADDYKIWWTTESQKLPIVDFQLTEENV